MATCQQYGIMKVIHLLLRNVSSLSFGIVRCARMYLEARLERLSFENERQGLVFCFTSLHIAMQGSWIYNI